MHINAFFILTSPSANFLSNITLFMSVPKYFELVTCSISTLLILSLRENIVAQTMVIVICSNLNEINFINHSVFSFSR